jgi:hypothetical protein
MRQSVIANTVDRVTSAVSLFRSADLFRRRLCNNMAHGGLNLRAKEALPQ